jgi:hypothetical protein
MLVMIVVMVLRMVVLAPHRSTSPISVSRSSDAIAYRSLCIVGWGVSPSGYRVMTVAAMPLLRRAQQIICVMLYMTVMLPCASARHSLN